MMTAITLAKKNEEEQIAETNVSSAEQIFRRVLIKTIVYWAEESVRVRHHFASNLEF